MSRSRFARQAVLVLLAALTHTLRLDAQTPTATFLGVVRDEAGGAVADAEVTLENLDNGWMRTARTRGNGAFHVPLAPIGRYRLRMIKASYAEYRSEGLRASAGQAVVVDPVMRLATVEATVEVVERAPLVDPTTSSVGTTLREELVQSIPVDARDVLNLALLSPGALPGRQGGYDGQVEVAVGGLMGIDNAFTVDGSLFNDPTFGFPIFPLPLDATEEFHFATQRYGADLGGGSGGVVNLVTRSGSNELHGGAFGFFRNRSFDARDRFAPPGADPDPFRRGQFGFTLGGPIQRDRSHFFIAYDGSHSDQTQTVDTAGTRPELEEDLSVTHEVGGLLAKVDAAVGESHRVTARFNHGRGRDRNAGFGPDFAESARFAGNLTGSVLEIADQWALSGDRYNEFRVQFFHNQVERTPNSRDPFERRPSSSTGGLNFFPYSRTDNRIQLVERFTWFAPGGAAAHVLKLGGELLVNRNRVTRTVFSPAGVYLFETDAPFDPADPATFPTLAIFGYTEQERRTVSQGSVWVQDDWTVSRRLTLNLGLRWDVEKGAANDDIANPVPYLERPRLDTDNFAPRAGFAYRLDEPGRTVLRGGYGRYYTRLYGILDFTGSRGSSGSITFVSNPDYQGFSNPNESETSSETSLVGTRPDIEIPYSHQFSLGVDRAVGKHWALAVDVVGIRGHREVLQVEGNPLDPRTGAREHPEFGSVPVLASIGHSTYDGLQVNLRSRGARWGEVNIAYTLSRARNDHTWFYTFVDSEEALGTEEGLSLNDQRHRLVISGAWRLPWRLQLGGVLTLASGQPYDINTGEDADSDGVLDRPAGVERNAGRVDGFQRFDLRLGRPLTLQRWTLEPMVEAYNLLNRRNVDPDTVNGNMRSPGFGQGRSTLHPLFISRQVQFGMRVGF